MAMYNIVFLFMGLVIQFNVLPIYQKKPENKCKIVYLGLFSNLKLTKYNFYVLILICSINRPEILLLIAYINNSEVFFIENSEIN